MKIRDELKLMGGEVAPFQTGYNKISSDNWSLCPLTIKDRTLVKTAP